MDKSELELKEIQKISLDFKTGPIICDGEEGIYLFAFVIKDATIVLVFGNTDHKIGIENQSKASLIAYPNL